jgi:hypothetical protein
MLEPIQNNDNYKPHAKHYSNLSMFTKVIASEVDSVQSGVLPVYYSDHAAIYSILQ